MPLSDSSAYFYISTPIYYVNDVPHIGHAYTSVAADVLARWHRLKGDRVFFLTGTDEHGQKVATSAAEHGRTPQEWCDEMAPHFAEMGELIGMSNDDFIRTTEPRHLKAVDKMLEALRDADDLYVGDYEGYYSVFEETYFAKEDLVDAEGNPGGDLDPMGQRPVEFVRESNYYFRLSKYEQALLEHIEANPDFIEPVTRRNEVLGFIRQGLKDVSFSRTTFDWGVPYPWDPAHVAYVWPDALTNYMSAVGYGSDDERYARDWPASIHLVGKDILRFHAVIWPAMLMSVGLPLPHKIFAHGWLLSGGVKMSKSRANKIAPQELIDEFGVDCYRYYFLRDISFGPDGSFSWEAMLGRYNTDLANDLGNLASRVLNMVERYLGGVSPKVPVEPDGGAVDELRVSAASAVDEYGRLIELLDFDDALVALWGFLHAANRFVEDTAPWHLAKDETQSGRLADVLGAGLEALRIAAILISPVMPGAAARLWDKLGLDGSPDAPPAADTTTWGGFPEGVAVTKGDPLFPRKDAEAAG